MVYIPFVYFTILLFFCWKKVGWGLATSVISIIDLTAFCAILIEWLNLYGDWGINSRALNIPGVFFYCLGWTVVLLPFMRLDVRGLHLELRKPFLFKCLCWFLIAASVVYIAGSGYISSVKETIVLSGAEAYEKGREAVVSDTGLDAGKNLFWLWIPLIVMYSWPLTLLCWFVQKTMYPNNTSLSSILLLLVSCTQLLITFANGGRAMFLWWLWTFYVYFSFFYKRMNPSMVRKISRLFIFVFVAFLLAFLSISFSRFNDGFAMTTLYSLVGYAGQQLNNFNALFPYYDMVGSYTRQVFPLVNLFLGTPWNAEDYITMLESKYDFQMNVFFTFMGRIAFDFGIVGVLIFLLLYYVVFYFLVVPKNNQLEMSQLILLAVFLSVPIRGIFNYPFVTHFNSAYIIMSFGLYVMFRYKFK